MKYEEELKNRLTGIPFDDSIDAAHMERLKSQVLSCHAAAAGSGQRRWAKAAAIIFAVGAGLIICLYIFGRENSGSSETKTPVAAAQPVPASPQPQTQASELPIWSKDRWRKEYLVAHGAQRPARRIIWISPTQKPIQGDER